MTLCLMAGVSVATNTPRTVIDWVLIAATTIWFACCSVALIRLLRSDKPPRVEDA